MMSCATTVFTLKTCCIRQNKQLIISTKNLQNTLNAAQAMAADAQAMQVASAQMAQALQSWAEELKNSQTKRTEEAAMLEEQNQNLRQELELLTRSLADMRIAADRLTSELDDQMTQNDLSLPG